MEISSRKLIVGFVAVFLLGVMFSLVNGYYSTEEGSSLPLIVYAISFVSVLLGGFIVVLFQAKINKVQLARVLKILPLYEQKIVKLLLDKGVSYDKVVLPFLSLQLPFLFSLRHQPYPA